MWKKARAGKVKAGGLEESSVWPAKSEALDREVVNAKTVLRSADRLHGRRLAIREVSRDKISRFYRKSYPLLDLLLPFLAVQLA